MRVLLPASMIPDGATVRKRTGESCYVLRHNLTLYQNQSKEHVQPIVVEGYFLCGDRGNISQIREDLLIHWEVTVEELYDFLREAIEGIPQ